MRARLAAPGVTGILKRRRGRPPGRPLSMVPIEETEAFLYKRLKAAARRDFAYASDLKKELRRLGSFFYVKRSDSDLERQLCAAFAEMEGRLDDVVTDTQYSLVAALQYRAILRKWQPRYRDPSSELPETDFQKVIPKYDRSHRGEPSVYGAIAEYMNARGDEWFENDRRTAEALGLPSPKPFRHWLTTAVAVRRRAERRKAR
jgi:hypothetical protein